VLPQPLLRPAQQGRKEVGNSSFLKKEPKNFYSLTVHQAKDVIAPANWQKFFGSFFQKRTASLFA
jgi:hypothetical protein